MFCVQAKQLNKKICVVQNNCFVNQAKQLKKHLKIFKKIFKVPYAVKTL